MRHYHLKKQPYFCPEVNVDRQAKLVPKEIKSQIEGTNKVPVINCIEAGYFKVLGSGNITMPLIVKAKFFSRKAEEKIRKAGGICIPIA